MKTITVEKIIINPEFMEVTISIFGLLSSFVINLSFLENPELKEPALDARETIIEIVKKKYLKADLLK